jgi:type IV fimbrial biogenesis protein FimT
MRSRGFTLIELLITIALAGILTALAAPSMTSMVRGNRIQTEASSLIGDLQYARTEAIKRGQPVSVCPSSNGTACLAANTWQSGWIIFNDLDGSGNIGTNDVVLRIRKQMTGGDTVVASPVPATNAITFNREGFTVGLGTATMMFQLHTADSNAKLTRCISVDLGGRLNTLISGATSGGVTCS